MLNPPKVDHCPKCGSMNVTARYDSAKDVLEKGCTCGYSWNSPPLDAARKGADREEKLFKLSGG